MATRTIDEAFGSAAPSSPSVVSTSGHLILTILGSLMKSANGGVPKELWGLCRALDLVAPRGFVIKAGKSFTSYRKRSTEAGRYPIVSLRTDDIFNKQFTIYDGIKTVHMGECFNYPLDIPLGVEKLRLGACFDHPITLPPSVKELEFSFMSSFNHPLVLPQTLRRLSLSKSFNRPITLSESLEAIKFGWNFNQELTLNTALKVLDFGASDFNRPLQLPAHLEELHLNTDFNQIITLPDTVHTVTVGSGFRTEITFGAGVRKLKWLSNRTVHLPPTLKEVVFGDFQRQVDLPAGLEVVKFEGEYEYNHPLILPSSLKMIKFRREYDFDLDVPVGCVRLDPPVY